MSDKERNELIKELHECHPVPMPDYSNMTHEELKKQVERMRIIQEVFIQAIAEGHTDEDDDL